MPTGHHVRIQADVEGMDIVRSYTPVMNTLASTEHDGKLHLLIKIYQDGALTSQIKKVDLGTN